MLLLSLLLYAIIITIIIIIIIIIIRIEIWALLLKGQKGGGSLGNPLWA